MTVESQLQTHSRIDRLDHQLTVAAAEARLDQARFVEQAAHRLYMAARSSDVWTFRSQWRAAAKQVVECEQALNDVMVAVNA